MLTSRVQRMIDSAPEYYQESIVFGVLQEVQGNEYDTVDAKNEDLRNQLYIPTATWGLKYWEECVKIPTNTADSYDVRRSRVLSRWRGFGNFSAALISSVCMSFANGEVDVDMDVPNQTVIIKFVGVNGIPPNIDDLKAAVEDIMHAHLGTTYKFTYVYWDVLEGLGMTFDELGAYIWDSFNSINSV